jgi:hypothetical protein
MTQQDDNCAHSLSVAWGGTYPALFNGSGKHFVESGEPKVMRCSCKAIVRARDVRAWAAGKGTKVNSYQNQGVYVIF